MEEYSISQLSCHKVMRLCVIFFKFCNFYSFFLFLPLRTLHYSNAALAKAIDNAVSPLSPTDPDVLMLKAISSASTHCLLQCLALIQRHHEISGDVRVRSHSEAAF